MSKQKILIVEDDESLLKLGIVLLTSRGYEVNGVVDGQAALDVIGSMQPDLVLLDIMLPKIDGFEVCRQIKNCETTRHIPVIMVTAKSESEDIARGKQVGVDWYMAKPFKLAMFIETIQRFLAGDLKPALCSP